MTCKAWQGEIKKEASIAPEEHCVHEIPVQSNGIVLQNTSCTCLGSRVPQKCPDVLPQQEKTGVEIETGKCLIPRYGTPLSSTLIKHEKGNRKFTSWPRQCGCTPEYMQCNILWCDGRWNGISSAFLMSDGWLRVWSSVHWHVFAETITVVGTCFLDPCMAWYAVRDLSAVSNAWDMTLGHLVLVVLQLVGQGTLNVTLGHLGCIKLSKWAKHANCACAANQPVATPLFVEFCEKLLCSILMIHYGMM